LVPEERMAFLEQHLGTCADCQQKLEHLSGADTLKLSLLDRAAAPIEHLPEGLLDSGRRLGEEVSGEDIAISLGDFLEAPTDDTMLGRLGEYEVHEFVARGGMGIVLKAWEPALTRFVAIKVLAPELAISVGARDRFLREARAAAAIDHENILPIYRVDQKGTLPYLVMPYVDGENLQERLDRLAMLSAEESTHIVSKIASGLQAAHEKGLVHRDIKPGNILLDRDSSRIWVTDFGLARAAEEASLTRSGTLIGTPAYMSPEQVDGKETDARSDLFSLGAVLYTMLTGSSPFAADSLVATVRKVVDIQPLTPRAVKPEVPETLSKLTMQLLEKDAARRPDSMREIVDTLQDKNQLIGPPQKSGAPFWVWVALLILVAAWWGWSQWGQPELVAATIAPDSVEQIESIRFRTNGQHFIDLQEAIDYAPVGGIVHIEGSGTREWHPVSINNKPLTISVAKGARPRFTHSNRVRLIRTNAPLILEGLNVAQLREGQAAAFVYSDGAPVWATNCRFTRSGSSGRLTVPIPMFYMIDSCDLELNNSFLAGFQASVIKVRGDLLAERGIKLNLSGNLIFTHCSMALDQDAAYMAQVSLSRNTLAHRIFFLLIGLSETGPMRVESRYNFFDVSKGVISMDGATVSDLTSSLQWQGVGNRYETDSVFLDGAERVNSVADWKSLWGADCVDAGNVKVVLREKVLPHRRTPEDIELANMQIPSALFESHAPVGVDYRYLGPGEGLDAWRETEEYDAWKRRALKAVDALLYGEPAPSTPFGK
jgi:serine/threonine-protein kinase